MSLDAHLKAQGCHIREGYSQQVPGQINDLLQLLPAQGKVLEIGFNAGHSAELFLKHSSVNVVSFDIGTHAYVAVGKQFLDSTYPERHQLVLGNSTATIPEYQGEAFDLIFVDGGHDYATAIADLRNCQPLAHNNTIVLIDDVVLTGRQSDGAGWTVGPTRAWKEMTAQGHIEQLGANFYSKGRGMAWGRYHSGQ